MSSNPLRILFMGTPDFAVPTLTRIHDEGCEIAATYTRAPRPAGRRGLEVVPSPVEAEAKRLGLEVLTPPRLSSEEEAARLMGFKPDVIVVVAYGLILPKRILGIPPFGCLNLHASLLPRWRGAAPIQRAIMAGDRETGVMVMRMEEGLDTGPVALTARLAIGPESRADEISAELAAIGAGLMVRTLALLEQGELSFTPQAAEGVTYAHKIDKAEARLDWTRPAKELHNLIRALAPFP
ncbi:MAG: methionyl-tRNA formyltransferase, partial [Alphaproteobacteria bacterium]|nr:methionyl-tRNA formyltransferase [Alphaproteobacteria bacterium]